MEVLSEKSPDSFLRHMSVDVPLGDLLTCYHRARLELQWSDTIPTIQSAILGRRGDHNYLTGTGSLADLPYPEDELCELLPFYVNSPVAELIESLPFRICRMRWMVLAGKACYSVHRDPSPRLHIPIITSEQSYFIFKDKPTFLSLEVGHAYVLDTRREHTAINGAVSERVHLVATVLT